MIKILPEHLINQIAAGEVVERPSSVVKELMENSIDAGALNVDIHLLNGGKNLIRVLDDGRGMDSDDLSMCVMRHATSKVNTNNIYEIETLGFRGEAIPSIASVAKIKILSKSITSQGEAYELFFENKDIKIKLAVFPKNGTIFEVRDLFYNVPVRLKFLRGDITENNYCVDVFKRIAMAKYSVNFSFKNTYETSKIREIKYFNLPELTDFLKLENRVKEIMGSEFINNSIYINKSNDFMNIYGFISVATFNSSQNNNQYFIVNGRYVKDKTLYNLVKIAYKDILANNRYHYIVLFLDLKNTEIDFNVNPAKTDVRFKDIATVRSFVISSIKNELSSLSNQKTYVNSLALNKVNNFIETNTNYSLAEESKDLSDDFFDKKIEAVKSLGNLQVDNKENLFNENLDTFKTKFGKPKAQIFKNFIFTEINDDFFIIDMHAAHERIMHEKILEQFNKQELKIQYFLHPILIEVNKNELDEICEYLPTFLKMGLEIEVFGENVLLVRGCYSFIKIKDVKQLVVDLINDCKEVESFETMDKKINKFVGTIACHLSYRMGDVMNLIEMENFLGLIEKTMNNAQCSHGRPTYVKLTKKDLEKMFLRI